MTPAPRYHADTHQDSYPSTRDTRQSESIPPTPQQSISRYAESTSTLPTRPNSPARGVRYEIPDPVRAAYASRPRASSPPPSSMGRVDDRDHMSAVRSAVLRTVPASETGTGTGSITDNLQKLKLTSFYVRPGFGKEGKSVDVLSNFFAVRAKDGRGKIIQ